MSVAVPVIDHIDWVNRRIYLKENVIVFNWMDDIFKEHRNHRRLEIANARNFDPLIKGLGNDNKGGGKATPRYTKLLLGAKVIPFDDGKTIIAQVECSTDDPDNDPEIFDTSGLVNPKVIYPAPAETEIIYVGGSTNDTDAPTWNSTVGVIDVYQVENTLKVKWGAASDASGFVKYNVYISTDQLTVFDNLLTSTEANLITLESDGTGAFENGVTYYVGVRAVDSSGNEDANTNTDFITMIESQLTLMAQKINDILNGKVGGGMRKDYENLQLITRNRDGSDGDIWNCFDRNGNPSLDDIADMSLA